MELREYLFMFASLLEDTMKDTDEQPADSSAEVWEHPERRSLCPHGVGVSYPPNSMGICSPT